MSDKFTASLTLAAAVHNASPEYHPNEISEELMRLNIKMERGIPLTLNEENFMRKHSKGKSNMMNIILIKGMRCVMNLKSDFYLPYI